MNSKQPADETQNSRRNDDMGLELPFGIKVRARGRSAIFVVIALGCIALLFWHDYKSDQANRDMHEALWTNILVLATPEKDRQTVLKAISQSAAVPASVKEKIGKQ